MNNNNEIVRQIKKFKQVLKQGGKKKNKYFLGKTFSAKLFIKLCSKVVDTSIICLEILNFEQENRTKEDIETVLPWMKELKYFYEYISMKETEETKKEILKRIIWVLYRKIFYKNTIIKKIDDNNRLICVILEGFLIKLDLIFYREVLSLEEYLIYLIKMEILEEKEIINKCKFLNKSFVDIDTDSIKDFCCKNNNIYDYETMKAKALKELIQYDIIFPIKKKFNEQNQNKRLKSIDNYLEIFLFKSSPKALHDKTRAYYNFYLGKYVKNGIIKKGQYIGSFLKEDIKDHSRYISKEKCIVGLINKEKCYSEKLYQLYTQKMIRIFSDIKNKFFIFHHIQDDIFYQKYVPYMHYHKYVKGEKIFCQSSIYEGIFLLTKGTIKISVNTSIDEMKNIMTYLTYSLNNFNEYVSGFNTQELAQNNLKNKLTSDKNEINNLYSKKEEYELMKIKEFNILGTNETYEHKTELYNFTAECESDSAILYFFPKNHLLNLLNKEKMVYNCLIELVEFRIRDLIWKMKRYTKEFERGIKYHKNNNFVKTFSDYIQKESINSKIIHRNDRNELTNKINNMFLTRNDFNRNLFSNNNKLFYTSKTNLDEEIKIKNIKKLFNENEKNKEGFYTTRKTKIDFRKNKNLIIPTIHSVSRNKRKEYYTSRSQAKTGSIKYMPDIFPFIVIDSFTCLIWRRAAAFIKRWRSA